MIRGRLPHWRRLLWLGAALLSTSGCTMLASRDAAEKRSDENRPGDESFVDAAHYERPGKSTSKPFSVTDRGREIERDFGIR